MRGQAERLDAHVHGSRAQPTAKTAGLRGEFAKST